MAVDVRDYFVISAAGEVLRLIPPRCYRLGRKADNDIIVPDTLVSRRHAELRWWPGRGHWILADLGSRNGTLVENRRIDKPAPLGDRMCFRLGSYTYTLRIAPSGSDPSHLAGDSAAFAAGPGSDGAGEGSNPGPKPVGALFVGGVDATHLPRLLRFFAVTHLDGRLALLDEPEDHALWFIDGDLMDGRSGEKVGLEALRTIIERVAACPLRYAFHEHQRSPRGRSIMEDTGPLLDRLLPMADRPATVLPGMRHAPTDSGLPTTAVFATDMRPASTAPYLEEHAPDIVTAALVVHAKASSRLPSPAPDLLRRDSNYAPDDITPAAAMEIDPALTPAGDLAGHVLGNYELIRQLGRGTASQVYLARHRVLGQDCAVKIMTVGDEAVQRERRAQFDRHSRQAASIVHRHVVRILDAGIGPSGELWIAMELVQGQSLAELLERRGPLRDRSLLRYAPGLAEGLAMIHSAGVAHRDLKPANVLVDRCGDARIADLGLPRIERDEGVQRLTGHALVLGTPAYLAPEGVIEDEAGAAKSDIFAFGALCYTLLSGQPTAEGADACSIIEAQRAGRRRPLAEAVARCDDELRALIERCLDLDPANRPTAALLAATLRRIQSRLGVADWWQPGISPLSLRRRELWQAILIGAAVGAGLAVLAMLLR